MPAKHKRLRIVVTLLEDLHSGTGTRGAVVDAVQSRDRRGRPVVRGTHLKGLLRAAADELVALGVAGVDATAVRSLFGGAGDRGALTVTSLRSAADAATVTWAGSARRPGERGPMDDTLHSVEHLVAGTRLHGTLELSDPAHEALVRRCLRRTTHLGARRSRGAGLVRIEVSVAQASTRGAPPAPAADRLELRLVLRAVEPLCLPVTGTPDNVIPTESHIRGQVLLGALARRAIETGDDATVRLLLDRTSVRVGNAYPLPDRDDLDATRLAAWDVMPVPLDQKFPKPVGAEHPLVPWWVFPDGSGEDAKREKRPGDREFLFRPSRSSSWQRFVPTVSVHLRNRVQTADRATDLFATEEIAEDTRFLATLRFDTVGAATTVAAALADVLSGREWLRLGRGGTPVEVLQAQWCAAARGAPAERHHPLALTLDSDLIARGPALGHLDALDPAALVDLAVTDDAERRALRAVNWSWTFRGDTVEVRGFNAVTGLPRMPALAIRRGSHLQVEGPPEAVARLRSFLLRVDALGERTWEGFGRFRMDEKVDAPPMVSSGARAPDTALEASERTHAAAMATAETLRRANLTATRWMGLHQRLSLASEPEKALESFIREAEERKSGEPWVAGSQTGTLRTLATALRGRGEAHAFLDIVVRHLRLDAKARAAKGGR